MSSSNIYYVYAYLRSKDSETAKAGNPYYIGKGTGKRAWTKHHFNIPKNKTRIVIIEDNLTEIGALALERRLIKWYGRKDNDTGILQNETDGGDGLTSPSKETRERISKGNSGPLSDRWGQERATAHKEHMKELAKLPERRKVLSDLGKKGAQHIVDNGWSTVSIDKRRKSRLLNTVKRIQDYYHQPYTETLRIQARKDKVAFIDKVALSKYITAEDIRQLSCVAQ